MTDSREMEALKEFPARLKKAMGHESALAFASKCGFGESLLRKYLSGESKPGLENFLAMAEAAGVRMEWLAKGILPMRPGDAPEPEGEVNWRDRLSNRLHQVMARGASVPELASKAGVHVGQLRAWAADRGAPTHEQLVAIARAADVRLEWLEKGEGAMREEGSYARVTALEHKPVPIHELQLTLLPATHLEKLSASLAEALGLETEEAALFTVEDEAMAPMMKVGERILVDTSPRGRIAEHGTYLLYFKGYRIRRLSRPSSGEWLYVQENSSVPTVEVPMGSRVVGRVVSVIRKL